MQNNKERIMSENKKGKIIISGEIELLTGLHIGSGGQGGIGLVDSPVIRNPLNNEPYIPGSSLKGRLRDACHKMNPHREGDKKTESSKVLNLFGMSPLNDKQKENYQNANPPLRERCTSLVYLRDAHLTMGQDKTNICEIKYENKIDRVRGIAEGGLRQIERVVAGTRFDFEVVYCIEESYKKDLADLEACFKFLEDEYLGASGSRGYGKVKFHFKEIAFRSLDYYKASSANNELKISAEDDLSSWATRASKLIEENKAS